tara:strand:- start:320 stop:649 length:330 start_codon:yes stop_codon:yes gene_type:complete
MPRNYIPKTAYFAEHRIQKIAKDLISDCKEDRQRALEVFDFFQNMVATDHDDDKSKAEMSKALELSQDANNKIVKVLELMLKMTMTELRESKSAPEKLSFEDLKNEQKR